MNKVIKRYYQQINDLKAMIDEIQEKCSHPEKHVTYEFGANTGNYWPGDDCYWTYYYCSVCDKKWRVDGSTSYGTEGKVN